MGYVREAGCRQLCAVEGRAASSYGGEGPAALDMLRTPPAESAERSDVCGVPVMGALGDTLK